jgi:copper oxidase (laccase) domain-containing protein
MRKDFAQSLSTDHFDLLDCEGAVRCYVCSRGLNKTNAVYVGGGKYRCNIHRERTFTSHRKREKKGGEIT